MNWSRFTLLVVALWPACGRSPVAPSPAPPASRIISGAWSGSYVPICPGSPTCASVGQAPTGAQPLSLALTQHGEAITGQINLGGWLPRVANVSGTVAPNGVMTLHGGESWPALSFCRPAGGWSINIWNARHDAQSDLISGDFEFVTQKYLSSCYYTQDLRVNATSVVLRHGDIPTDSSMAGHWQGSYAISRCTPVGWQSCLPVPLETDPAFNLELSQTGSTVSGTIVGVGWSNNTPLPVSGDVGGNRLNLTGSRSEIVGWGTHSIRITSWAVNRDEVGRLQGHFSFIDEVRWTEGPNAGSTWSTSYDAELRYVVKVPW